MKKSLFKKEVLVNLFDKHNNLVNRLTCDNSMGFDEYHIIKRLKKDTGNLDISYTICESYDKGRLVTKSIGITNWSDGCKAKQILLYVSKTTGEVSYNIVKEY